MQDQRDSDARASMSMESQQAAAVVQLHGDLQLDWDFFVQVGLWTRNVGF